MKKQLLFLSFCIIAAIGLAQVPYKMSYQTVVRNSSNLLVNNQQVGIKVSLLQGGATGTAVFTQLFTPTTNANGLASIAIGDTSPAFVNINWGSGPFFIKTEIDPTGGTNYSIEGVSELMSVPYAVYARYTSNQGKNTLIISGDISDAEAAAKILRDVGPNTQHIRIEYTHNLTNIDFSIIKAPINTIDIEVIHNDKLASINFGLLESNEDALSINNNYNLKTILFPSFKTSEGDVIISDAISQITFPKLEHILYNFNLSTDSSFTTLDLPLIKYIATGSYANSFKLNIPNLQQINAPLLESIGTDLNFSDYKFLQTINLPALKTIKKLVIVNDSLLTAISLPSLESITDISISLDSSLTNIYMPNLKTCGQVYINSCPLIKKLDFPNLEKTAGNFYIRDCISLKTINFDVLNEIIQTYFHVFQIYNNDSLTSVNFGASAINLPQNNYYSSSLAKFYIIANKSLQTINLPNFITANDRYDFDFEKNSLATSTVNSILNKFTSITAGTYTNWYLNLKSQTPPAPPTGTGITDKATLISRGITVATD